jgi:hypothetical protein
MVVRAVPVCSSTIVMAIDVGKTEFAFSVTDAARRLLLKPRTGCPMTASSLRERGKKGGVIACAMANRANRIAYALVRDQQPYDPSRWLQEV